MHTLQLNGFDVDVVLWTEEPWPSPYLEGAVRLSCEGVTVVHPDLQHNRRFFTRDADSKEFVYEFMMRLQIPLPE